MAKSCGHWHAQSGDEDVRVEDTDGVMSDHGVGSESRG